MIKGRDKVQHSGLTDEDELGAAVSYYFVRNPLKLQADYFRYWEPDNFDKGLDQIRVQLQLSL
jgi:hypothetical protein